MMNIWAPDGADSWTGEWNPNILPLFAYYDWVSYAAYTPDSGNTGTDNNFLTLWRDDFNSMDTERWQTATHTWGGNRVDFTPDNIVFKDGKLILCLTNAENTGFVDQQAPVILWARVEKNHVLVRFSENVDSLTAVNPLNYGIAGLEINGIELKSDKRTVILSTSDIIADKSYALAAFNIKDASPEGNVRSQDVTQVINNTPLVFPIRINVGGEAIYDNKYLPDQIWSPDVEYGRMDGWIEKSNNDIIGTNEDSLYQIGCSEIVKYQIRVPAGIYSLELMMAENRIDQIGSRVFSIVVEGNKIATNLDLIKEVGQHTAYKISVSDLVVNDGILDIHFTNWIDKPLLNGIVVDKISSKVKAQRSIRPRTFNVFQNYPNPFNPNTFIEYDLPDFSDVNLTVYNRVGQIVECMDLGYKTAGRHQKEINLNLASGIYFYKVSAASSNTFYVDVKKMIVLK